MPKFQIVSDLHIEKVRGDPKSDLYIEPSTDILILAGDIGRIHLLDQLKKFLVDVCSKFKLVLYVLGNNEFYYSENSTEHKTIPELLLDLREAVSGISNLRILNRDSIIIEDVCVVGCTLWTLATASIPKNRVRIKGITTTSYNKMHAADLEYLEDRIEHCKKHGFKILVVTHHPPSTSLAPVLLEEEKVEPTPEALSWRSKSDTGTIPSLQDIRKMPPVPPPIGRGNRRASSGPTPSYAIFRRPSSEYGIGRPSSEYGIGSASWRSPSPPKIGWKLPPSFGPSKRDKKRVYTDTRYSYMYYNDLDYLLSREKVHTWVFGHIHHNSDFHTKGGTRLISNQRGKPGDLAKGFSHRKVIEI